MYDFYKNCEESLKKTILQNYGKYLSNLQIKSFNNKEYITNDVMGIKKLNDLFNHLSDKMLDDLLNITTVTKNIVNDDTSITIPCGNTFKKILKNYYKIDISKKLSFSPIINYNYAHDLDIINFFNEEYNNIIDKNVFNKNVIELSQIKELSEYIDNTIIIDTNKVISE